MGRSAPVLEIGVGLALRMVVLGTVVGAFSVSACAPKTDIGDPCSLKLLDGGPWLETSQTNDIFIIGTPQCENLVCLRPAGATSPPGQGICSNLCTPEKAGDPNSPSNDCSSRETNLVCRKLALDQSFIDQILALDGGAELLQKYLGSDSGNYCTTPTPTE